MVVKKERYTTAKPVPLFLLLNFKRLFLLVAVHGNESLQILVSLVCLCLRFSEQSCCFLRVSTFQRVVTNLAVQEILVALCRSLGIQSETSSQQPG